MDPEQTRAAERLNAVIQSFGQISMRHVPAQTIPGTRRGNWSHTSAHDEIDRGALRAWVVRAQRALEDVFPASDSVCRQWSALGDSAGWSIETANEAHGIVRAAYMEVTEGHVLRSLTQRVRAQTEQELIEQARVLLSQGDGWAAAATLLAGAALELRLHDLATVREVTLNPKSTLGGVITALKDARSDGKQTFAPSNDSLLARWLHMRNDAAHRTATFPWSAAQVLSELGPLELFLRTH